MIIQKVSDMLKKLRKWNLERKIKTFKKYFDNTDSSVGKALIRLRRKELEVELNEMD